MRERAPQGCTYFWPYIRVILLTFVQRCIVRTEGLANGFIRNPCVLAQKAVCGQRSGLVSGEYTVIVEKDGLDHELGVRSDEWKVPGVSAPGRTGNRRLSGPHGPIARVLFSVLTDDGLCGERVSIHRRKIKKGTLMSLISSLVSNATPFTKFDSLGSALRYFKPSTYRALASPAFSRSSSRYVSHERA